MRWIKSFYGDHSSGGNDYCKNGRQALLYKDLLISDLGKLARAIDKKTGELRWSHPTTGHEIASPIVMTIGGTDVLWCCGPNAFRLPDGKPLTIDGWRNSAAQALLNTDQRDTVYFTGGGEHGGWENKGGGENPPPAAVKFTLAGETLKAKILWAGVDGQPVRHHTGLVYLHGKIYHPSGFVLDAATGKVASGSRERGGNRVTPPTGHTLQIANGFIYGLAEGRGSETTAGQTATLHVYTLDGKKVAESTMTNAPAEGEKAKQIIEQVGYKTWRFNYASPFSIMGDRVYVRSYDYLFCIAEK